MRYSALGNIEVLGKLAAITAADVALKAANVKLTHTETILGGLTTIYVTGDVAAVQAAIEAATEEVKKMSSFISSNVIANLDQQVMDMIIKDLKKSDVKKDDDKESEINTELSSNNDDEIDVVEKEVKVESNELMTQTDEISDDDNLNDETKENEQGTVNSVSPSTETGKVAVVTANNSEEEAEFAYNFLKEKRISELRAMAYDQVVSVSNEVIKNSTKNQIIALLVNEGIEIG